MKFFFEDRPSDSPFVEAIWRTQSNGGSFTSIAESHWGMVVTKQKDKLTFSMRGPETQALPAPVPEEAEIFGIIFKLGTFMTPLPARDLVNCEIHLPDAASKSFWFHGSAWQFPTFENVDTFLDRLYRQGLLVSDPIVHAVLQDQPQELSIRSVRRRFLHATGLTYGAIRQIQRAKQAVALLEQGTSILDTVYEAGYFDQPHLTRSLKQLMGRTPAQIVHMNASK